MVAQVDLDKFTKVGVLGGQLLALGPSWWPVSRLHRFPSGEGCPGVTVRMFASNRKVLEFREQTVSRAREESPGNEWRRRRGRRRRHECNNGRAAATLHMLSRDAQELGRPRPGRTAGGEQGRGHRRCAQSRTATREVLWQVRHWPPSPWRLGPPCEALPGDTGGPSPGTQGVARAWKRCQISGVVWSAFSSQVEFSLCLHIISGTLTSGRWASSTLLL